MSIYTATEENVELAVNALIQGQCIGLPTETVYGLAADGLNPEAVAKIFVIKKRPFFDPLILHVHRDFPLETICEPNEQAKLAMKHFWPGPLTVLLPKKAQVPDLVTSGLATVAVRCPSHAVAQQILQRLNKPLAAPSANRFGHISPTDAQAVDTELGEAVPIIIDGGACSLGLESTIVDFTQEVPCILRKGAVTQESLALIFPNIVYRKAEIFESPGALEHHYAPRTPLYLSDLPLADVEELPDDYAYFFWQKTPRELPEYYRLMEGTWERVAAGFFRQLRELDSLNKQAIVCDQVPEDHLGAAVQDRLFKASAGYVHWHEGKPLLTSRDNSNA